MGQGTSRRVAGQGQPAAGRLVGHMEALGFPLRQEAILQTLTSDVVKSSEIEGGRLDQEQVRSSIARRLGMDVGGLKPMDRNVCPRRDKTTAVPPTMLSAVPVEETVQGFPLLAGTR